MSLGPPRSLTLPFATAGVSRGGPGRAPLPVQVIKSPAAGQKLAAKHTPRARGVSAGHRGCHQPPPVMPAGQAEPPPRFGDSPQGLHLLGPGPPCLQGGPDASAGPCAEQAAALPHLCHPNGGLEPKHLLMVAAPKQLCLGQGDARRHADLQIPLTSLPGGSGTSGVPRHSPTSGSHGPGAGGGTSRLRGFGKGNRCLWVMPP